MFRFMDVFAENSGPYLPGPTEAGVAVSFLRPPPPGRRAPKVYLGATFNSGLSLGRYCGPGFYSRLFACIYIIKVRSGQYISPLCLLVITYTRLSADFWRTSPRFPVKISLNGIIEEQTILVEVVFGFFRRQFRGVREGLTWGLCILNLVNVCVLGTWGVLPNVLSLGQLTVKLFALIPAIG